MTVFKVLDLPKGYPSYRYFPPRPTELTVRRGEKVTTEVYTLQKPLELLIGDELLLEGRVPAQLMQLAARSAGSPQYVDITEEVTSKKRKPKQPQPVTDTVSFIG